MRYIIVLLMAVCAAGWVQAQNYGGASSQQQKSGRNIQVADVSSSDSSSSDDSGDQDVAISPPKPAPVRGQKPLVRLPPVKGWVKAGASSSSSSDNSDDSSDDGGADAAPPAPQVSASRSSSQKSYSQLASPGSSSGGRAKISQQAKTSNAAATGDRAQQPVVNYPPIVEGGSPPPQVPGVWDALDDLRGKPAYGVEEIQDMLASAKPDSDYPILTEVPDHVSFNCANVKQAGYYADTDFRCQVFRRCDLDGYETSYLCPNLTLYNQITLVCDWFYNVNCANSAKYQDYSNSRLYHSDWLLFDTPPEKDNVDAGQVSAVMSANAGRPGARGSSSKHTHSSSSSHSQSSSSGSRRSGRKSSGNSQSAQLQSASSQQIPY